MHAPQGLRSRDPAAGARVTSLLTGFGALVLVPWALFLPPRLDGVRLAGCMVVAALLAAITVGIARADPDRLDRCGSTFAVAVLGGFVVGGLNLYTRDSSAAGQVFLVIPVLLAAMQLRRTGALLASGLSVLVCGTATVLLDGGMQGWTDAVVVGAAMLAVTVVLVRAADRRDAAFAEVRQQASSDGLTGLLRRRALDTALGQALVRGQVAVLMVDVDAFKQINDVHGHLVGDAALVHLAGVLRGQLRSSDCVVGRLGGDELVMVLPGCAREGLAGRAADLVAAVRAAPLPLPGGGALPLTVSVGAAHAPSDAPDLPGLYAAADAALYRAKRAGRDGFVTAS